MELPPPDAEWYLPTVVSVFSSGVWTSAFDYCTVHEATLHVITAWNPGAERPTLKENDHQNNKLETDIRSLGFSPLPAFGADPNSDHAEASWAVVGLKDEQAIELGLRYRQVAVFRITQSTQTVLGCHENWEVSRALC